MVGAVMTASVVEAAMTGFLVAVEMMRFQVDVVTILLMVAKEMIGFPAVKGTTPLKVDVVTM
jgi:hypothetical protein